MERAPGSALDLQFQSQTEETEETEQPDLTREPCPPPPRSPRSRARSRARRRWRRSPGWPPARRPRSAAKVESAPAVEASLEDALSSAVRELGAADGEKAGRASSGARWWREEGREHLEDGKVMTWTVIRGAIRGRRRGVGGEVLGNLRCVHLPRARRGEVRRDSLGQAWQESWKEIYQHDVNGTPFIHREASKWSHTPKGQCWSEGWTEDYRADGSVRSLLREDRRAGGRRRAGRGGHARAAGRRSGGGVGRARLLHGGRTPGPAATTPRGARLARPAAAGARSGRRSGAEPSTRTGAPGRGRVSLGTRWAAGTDGKDLGRGAPTPMDASTSMAIRPTGRTGTSGRMATAGGVWGGDAVLRLA